MTRNVLLADNPQYVFQNGMCGGFNPFYIEHTIQSSSKRKNHLINHPLLLSVNLVDVHVITPENT